MTTTNTTVTLWFVHEPYTTRDNLTPAPELVSVEAVKRSSTYLLDYKHPKAKAWNYRTIIQHNQAHESRQEAIDDFLLACGERATRAADLARRTEAALAAAHVAVAAWRSAS